MVTTSKLTSLKRKAKREGWLQWIRSEADERAVLNGCRFHVPTAEYVVEWFRRFLRHSKGEFASKPFELLDWQRDGLIMPLFGWLAEDGRRRYRKAYVQVAKKNGKSTIAAGIGLYMTFGDDEKGAEVYSAACDRPQALIVHSEAVRMVQQSPELMAAAHLQESTHHILHRDSASIFTALTKSPRSNQGQNAHCLIIDELHEWFGRNTYDALRWAGSARRQPLVFQITTAGDDPQSVAHQQYEYAKGVLAGTLEDEAFFPLVYEAAADDDPWDEATWRKANPSLGVTISEKSFRADAEEAKKTPADENSWRRYRCNQWVSGVAPWLKAEDWKACRRSFVPKDLARRKCWVGLDMAQSRDTCSAQALFPIERTRKRDGEKVMTYRLLSYFWLPRKRAEDQNHLVSWLAWGAQRHIELVPGRVMENRYVKKRLLWLYRNFNVQGLVYDPRYAEPLAQEVQAETGVEIIAFGQGMPAFAGPTAEFERLVLGQLIQHTGNPVMDWQMQNAQVKDDSDGNRKIWKPQRDEHRKVDGPIAAIMALGEAMTGGEDAELDLYPEEGMACYSVSLS